MDTSRKRRKEDLGQRPEDVFSGIVYCGSCGGRLIQNRMKKKGESKTPYIQYRCLNKNQIERFQCRKNSISANKLANLIKVIIQKEYALSELSPEDFIDKNREEREKQREKQKREQDRMERRIEYMKRNSSMQYRRYRMGQQKEEIYKKEIRNNEERVQVLEKKREEITTCIKEKDIQAARKEEIVMQLLTKGKKAELTNDIIQKLVCQIILWQKQRVEVSVLYDLGWVL